MSIGKVRNEGKKELREERGWMERKGQVKQAGEEEASEWSKHRMVVGWIQLLGEQYWPRRHCLLEHSVEFSYFGTLSTVFHVPLRHDILFALHNTASTMLILYIAGRPCHHRCPFPGRSGFLASPWFSAPDSCRFSVNGCRLLAWRTNDRQSAT